MIRTLSLFAILFLLGGILAYTPWVQTKLAQVLTQQLESRLNIHVEIDRVHMRFLNSTDIKGIYVADFHGDTLLYADRIQAQINHLRFRKGDFSLKRLNIESPVIKIHRYDDDQRFDYEIFIDRLDPDTVTGASAPFSLRLDNLLLTKASVHYKDAQARHHHEGYRLRDLSLDFGELFYDGKRVNAEFRSGSGYEDKGFELKKLEGRIAHAENVSEFEGFKLHTAKNVLELSGRVEADSLDTPSWTEHLTWDVSVDRIEFDPTEFRVYLPGVLRAELQKAELSGKTTGSIGDFETDDLFFKYGQATVVDGDVEMVGLPNTNELYINATELYARTRWSDLVEVQKIIPQLVLPAELEPLEYLVLNGSFTGYLNDFKANMTVQTAHGGLRANLDASYPADRPLEMKYQGKLRAIDCNVGAVMGIEDLGSVNFNLEVDGFGLTSELLNTDVSGQVKRFEYRGHNYTNGEVIGHLTQGLFVGRFKVNDPKLAFDFDGSIDIRDERPDLYFDLDVITADLFALGLVSDSIGYLSTSMVARFSGIGLDDARGTLKVKRTKYETEESVYFVGYMDLESAFVDGQRKLTVESDLLQGRAEGDFKINTLIQSLQGHFNQYFTGLDAPEVKNKQRLDYEFTLYNTLPITELFFRDLTIETGTRIYGSYSDDMNRLLVNLEAPGLDYQEYRIQQPNLVIDGNGRRFQSALAIDYIELPDGTRVDTFLLVNDTRRDSSLFDIYWTYIDSSSFAGSIHPYITFLDSAKWAAGFRPSTMFYLKDSIAIPGGNRIVANGKEVEIRDLEFYHLDQNLAVNGYLSENPRKSLDLRFGGLRIEYLQPVIDDKDTRLHGGIEGMVRLLDVYDEFNVIGDIAIDSLSLNDHFVGRFTAGMNWNDEMNAFAVNADIHRGKLHALSVSGAYFPGNVHDRVQLRMILDKMRVDAASKYTNAYLTNMRGALDAELELVIEGREMSLTGWTELRKVGFTVPQTAVDYNVDGVARVEFNERSIDFVDFNFRDNKHQTPGEVYGSIMHRDLRNWFFDLHVKVDSTLVLDTEEGEYYYGTAFGTGTLDVVGSLNRLKILIDAAAERGTEFALPLGGASSVSEHSFITFLDRSTTSYGSDEAGVRKNRNAGYEMVFDVEIKEGVEVELIFDETVGDILRGTGTGAFNIRMAEDGSMTMNGDYTIYSGTYLFTLQNLFSKRFNIQRGGTLKWTGDPYDADIDLTAVYPTRASLKPLGVSDSSRRRRPVEVDMNLTNRLMKPNIDFGIRVPNVNTALQEEVQLVVTRDENELNRQMISLLVMGSFITPETSANAGGNNLFNQGLTANTTEMLSNQLSRWISGINENIDVGVNYEAGNDLNSEQVEVALSTQLFNDRVLLNSNIGVPLEGGENTSNLVGDVEVEVKVSRDGRFRAKAFNRSDQNDPLSQQYQYKQGVGLVYTVDFENFEEFWRAITGTKKNE